MTTHNVSSAHARKEQIHKTSAKIELATYPFGGYIALPTTLISRVTLHPMTRRSSQLRSTFTHERKSFFARRAPACCTKIRGELEAAAVVVYVFHTQTRQSALFALP